MRRKDSDAVMDGDFDVLNDFRNERFNRGLVESSHSEIWCMLWNSDFDVGIPFYKHDFRKKNQQRFNKKNTKKAKRTFLVCFR